MLSYIHGDEPLACDDSRIAFYDSTALGEGPYSARRLPLLHGSPITGNKRASFFIAGPPGAGKSYASAAICRGILSERGHMPIYLFTDIEGKDDNFDRLKMRKVIMKEEVLSGITLDKLRQDGECICLFDDIDKVRDPKTERALIKLAENIIANGRSHSKGTGHIHTIITSHAINDYKKTKYSLENSDYVIVFPTRTLPAQLERLEKKLGLADGYLDAARRAGERSVIIHKTHPLYVLSSSFIELI